MKTQCIRSIAGIAMVLAAGSALAVTSHTKPAAEHVRGTVVQVGGHTFTVRTANGQRRINTTAETRFAGVVRSSLDQIKPGTFIGTANVADGDKSRALEVVVFPDAMKGTGLGNYAWDLKPGAVGATASSPGGGPDRMASGSSMTNGTVSGGSGNDLMAAGSSMTNGTVGSASGSNGRTLTVNYGDGRKTIQVPSNVPVVKVTKAGWTDVASGAHVFVAGPNRAGAVTADRVIVGLNGVVPPM